MKISESADFGAKFNHEIGIHIVSLTFVSKDEERIPNKRGVAMVSSYVAGSIKSSGEKTSRICQHV